MHELNERIIRAAVLESRLLQFRYDRCIRTVEPYLLGRNAERELVLRAWELSGECDGGWRDFRVPGVGGLAVVPGWFPASRPAWTSGDTTLTEVARGPSRGSGD